MAKKKVDTTYKEPKLPEDLDQLRAFALEMCGKVATLEQQKANMLKEREEVTAYLDAHEAQVERDRRVVLIRQEWRGATKAMYRSIQNFLTALPIPTDAQVFESDDWDRLEEVMAAFEHGIATCRQWRHRTAQRVIEA